MNVKSSLFLSLTSIFTRQPALRAKLLSESCIGQHSCHTSRELASMRFIRAIVNSLGFISFVPSFNLSAESQRKQINILNERTRGMSQASPAYRSLLPPMLQVLDAQSQPSTFDGKTMLMNLKQYALRSTNPNAVPPPWC